MLLQIEEPGEPHDELEDRGLAVGLELAPTALRVAISVGGNVEVVRGPAGGIDFLPAVAGYDENDELAAGDRDLADVSECGAAQLEHPEAVDRRGVDVVRRVAALVATARRMIAMRARRPVLRAVTVVPPEVLPGSAMALMRAVEAGGLEVQRLIETPVALATGGGLAGFGDGEYLFAAAVPGGFLLSRVAAARGMVRQVGSDKVAEPRQIRAVLAEGGPVRAVIASGLPDAQAIAAAAGAPLLEGFAAAELAVIGAAMAAESFC